MASRIPKSARKEAANKEFRDAKMQACGSDDAAQPGEPLTASWKIDNGLKSGTKTCYPPFEYVDRKVDCRIEWDKFASSKQNA